MEMVVQVNPTSGDVAAALTAAIEQVRQARRQGTLDGPAAIEFAAGAYAFTRGVTLTAADSGVAAAPFSICAARGQAVRFSGGRAVSGFKPVTDAAVLARLLPEARGAVLQADLRSQGITDFGVFHTRGFHCRMVPAMLELFYQGRPMPLTCWPKDGFATIKGVPVESKDKHGGAIGELENGFFYDGDRPARWGNLGDVIVHGYWAYDWANSYERIGALDTGKRHIHLTPPGGLYGYRAGQRIQFLNILEELGSPGQWYLDRCPGILYFWPPAPLREDDVTASLLEEPFFTLADAAHIHIEGITFETARGMGIHVTDGSDCRIEQCQFRNLGNYGVVVKGGARHAVRGCEMADLGDGGVNISGGDRQTLTPANHVVENNHINHVARWSKCYVPAVLGSGVGLRIVHNLIHDHPHCPILFKGNGFTVEYNEIHHVCLDTGDVGAIYTGRDYTFRDNVVRYNFIHHTGGVGLGSMGVYNDDCVSGTIMFGNVFWKVQ
ncbi:MAG: right-handed parallel beta-helix repeat-containing protein, partial [Lentisphaerae bacterium]|nr:right-handed parallel beta-helix repeat-containing protein [Lentisphaerota bacterium]